MIPMLPCADIDEVAEFWTALGLRVTYRQTRPNPYVCLGLGRIDLHYYGMPGHDPDQSHSTCGLVVSDTGPLHELFAAGFRSRFGRVPQQGAPRMTRPRPRANNAGLSGFSVIDPAGNWIRVSRRPDEGQGPRTVDDRVEWVSAGRGPLGAALENAIVHGDSHGDAAQARRILAGALARHPEAPVGDRAGAWAYLAELSARLGDRDDARQAAEEVRALADTHVVPTEEIGAVAAAVRDVGELDLDGT